MSFFDWLTNPFRRATLERRELEYQSDVLEYQSQIVEASSNTVDVKPSKGWQVIAGLSGGRIDDNITETDYYTILDVVMKLWIENETFRGILMTLTRAVFGKGPTFSPKMRELKKDETEEYTQPELESADRVQMYWDAFWRVNKLRLKDKEIGWRTFRDGDVFLNFMAGETDEAGKNMPNTVETLLDDGKTMVTVPVFRFIRAEKVRDPDGEESLGVKNIEGDAETPEAYIYDGDGTVEGRRVVPAEFVVHIKCIADSDWKRGLPLLLASNKTVVKRDQWVDAALAKLKLGACMVLHAKYDKGTAATTARTAGLKDEVSGMPTNVQKSLKTATFLRSGKGVDYDMITAKTQGTGADDGRLFDLQAARNVGLTEYEVSADASAYRNRSTADIVSDPSVRTKEDWQDSFGCHLVDMAERVLTWGKTLNDFLQEDDTIHMEIEWPPLTSRNAVDDAKAFDMDTLHGMSDRTYLEKRGLDPDQEFARRKLEAEAGYGEDAEADDREDAEREKGEKTDDGKDDKE